MNSTRRRLVPAILLACVVTACGAKLPPPTVGAPHYPEFIFPTLTPPDPRLADLAVLHQGGWQFLQAGDADRAEREFQTVLKRSVAFYPSDAALGYVEMARKNYPQALVGRGEALLVLLRDAEALASFEAALRADPALTDVGRRVEVLRARAAQ